jgi:hypothetical protein
MSTEEFVARQFKSGSTGTRGPVWRTRAEAYHLYIEPREEPITTGDLAWWAVMMLCIGIILGGVIRAVAG